MRVRCKKSWNNLEASYLTVWTLNYRFFAFLVFCMLQRVLSEYWRKETENRTFFGGVVGLDGRCSAQAEQRKKPVAVGPLPGAYLATETYLVPIRGVMRKEFDTGQTDRQADRYTHGIKAPWTARSPALARTWHPARIKFCFSVCMCVCVCVCVPHLVVHCQCIPRFTLTAEKTFSVRCTLSGSDDRLTSQSFDQGVRHVVHDWFERVHFFAVSINTLAINNREGFRYAIKIHVFCHRNADDGTCIVSEDVVLKTANLQGAIFQMRISPVRNAAYPKGGPG